MEELITHCVRVARLSHGTALQVNIETGMIKIDDEEAGRILNDDERARAVERIPWRAAPAVLVEACGHLRRNWTRNFGDAVERLFMLDGSRGLPHAAGCDGTGKHREPA